MTKNKKILLLASSSVALLPTVASACGTTSSGDKLKEREAADEKVDAFKKRKTVKFSVTFARNKDQ
ncbi:UNVERIFIED_CONTAM: hypothetical protein O8I53_07710 [Campylobacter lari]